MKITKWVDVEVEVEVDVSFTDVVGELPRTADNQRAFLCGLNMFHAFLKSVPDDMIVALNDDQRRIILDAFGKQLERIKTEIGGAKVANESAETRINPQVCD